MAIADQQVKSEESSSNLNESIVSFYAFGNTQDEKIRSQLLEQFGDEEIVERYLNEIHKVRESKN